MFMRNTSLGLFTVMAIIGLGHGTIGIMTFFAGSMIFASARKNINK